MGNNLSVIGRSCFPCLSTRRRSDATQSEEEQLIFGDPNAIGYGSFGDQNMNSQDGNVEVQRESESLQRVVAKTADSMVDIFEMAPEPDSGPRFAPAPFAYVGQEARIARYQHLAARLTSASAPGLDSDSEAASPATAQILWADGDGDDGSEGAENNGKEVDGLLGPTLLALPEGPLVGTFADAAAAMA